MSCSADEAAILEWLSLASAQERRQVIRTSPPRRSARCRDAGWRHPLSLTGCSYPLRNRSSVMMMGYLAFVKHIALAHDV